MTSLPLTVLRGVSLFKTEFPVHKETAASTSLQEFSDSKDYMEKTCLWAYCVLSIPAAFLSYRPTPCPSLCKVKPKLR